MTSPATARQEAKASHNHLLMLVKSTLAGGVILFVWQFISWGVIPWRSSLLHSFREQGSAAASIASNAVESGMYVLPMAHDMSGASEQSKGETERLAREGPIVFAAVRLSGVRPFGFGLTVQFLTQIVNALLLSIILLKANVNSYGSRIVFIITLALLAGIAGHIPNWNWFNFSTSYTVLEITDLLVGWSLAGLVMAKLLH